jgi:UDP-GlcNAc3NAcA epimerase
MPRGDRLRIVTVVGCRPQFVKAAPVSDALRACGVHEVLVHTGQHHDPEMSDVFFEDLEIPSPAYHLGVAGGSHGDMTGRILQALEPVLIDEAPDWVIVYGDTNSTLAGALCAAKLRLPVAHVEAGMRSGNRRMPEEINRIVTDHVSDLRLCSTTAAVENLAREGITSGVRHTGDVMYDVTLRATPRARERSRIASRLGVTDGAFALATVHRAENTDDPAQLARIVEWLGRQAADRPVVFPVHPRTRKAAREAGIAFDSLLACEPLGFLDMTRLLDGCTEVYTDSGGLQKEAYFHRKPCVTLRSETEWVETVSHGWNRLWDQSDYLPRTAIAEYGDGEAARRVVEAIVHGE